MVSSPHLFPADPTAAVGTAVTVVANDVRTGVLLSKYKLNLKSGTKREKKNLWLAARAPAATVTPATVAITAAVAIAAEGAC
jgi:hypothetical protein